MGTIKHSQLTSENAHTMLVDSAGILKVDTYVAGDDAVVRFLQTNNKKMVWNYSDNVIDFYMNSSTKGVSIGNGYVSLTEITALTSVVDGRGKLYTKSDNALYFQDGAGAEHTVTIS